MNKKAIVVIILTIIIAIATFLIINKKQNKFDYKMEQVKEYNYYTYRENDKFGVINKDGKIIINAKYSSVIIPNPDKDLFVCYNDESTEILNSNNQKQFTEYEKVEPIKLKNIASTLNYEKNILMYKKDNLYGLIDFKGKIITPNIYEVIENLQPTEGKFIVAKGSKYGVIDQNGNQLVEIKYDKIVSDNYYTDSDEYKKSGFLVLNKTDNGYKYGYVNYTGKIMLEAEYNEIERISQKEDENIYLIVSENGKYGLYKNSKKIIPNEYQAITNDDEDILILRKNKKSGAATLDGNIIINVENEELELRGIYLYAQKGEEKKVYDKKGNTINIDYDKCIYETESEKYKISTIQKDGITNYGIIDENGKQLVQEKYRYIEYIFNNYFIATNENGNIGIIDNNDKVVLEMKYNSLQKVKGKNIIQAMQDNNKFAEFYSINMEQTLSIEEPIISIQDDYIIVSNEEQKIYLDKDGKKIENISNLKASSYPSEIGEYKKEQTTIENVYYTKK